MPKMKKLHLIRHAKSGWASSALADIDRPLNSRGLEACRIMAAQMVRAGCPFDPVFCSPALRAQSTIEQIAQHLPDRDISWQTDNALYTFDAQDLLSWCCNLDDSRSESVIVGHNDAITDLCNWLGDTPQEWPCHRFIENVPTCGYVQLAFEQTSWRDLSAGSGKLLSFLKPKMFLSK